jgi:hypothetical protein
MKKWLVSSSGCQSIIQPFGVVPTYGHKVIRGFLYVGIEHVCTLRSKRSVHVSLHIVRCSSPVEPIAQMAKFAERFEQVVIERVHLSIGGGATGAVNEHLHPPQRFNQTLVGGELQVLQNLLDGAADGEQQIAVHLPADHGALAQRREVHGADRRDQHALR